jgi:hypothetical protein
MSTTKKTSADSSEKKKNFCPYAKKKADDKAASKLHIRKFVKGNNFCKFKVALLEVALEAFCNLGKLIKKESYYLPQFVTPDYAGQGLTQVDEQAIGLNALKIHQRKLDNMEDGAQSCMGQFLDTWVQRAEMRRHRILNMRPGVMQLTQKSFGRQLWRHKR